MWHRHDYGRDEPPEYESDNYDLCACGCGIEIDLDDDDPVDIDGKLYHPDCAAEIAGGADQDEDEDCILFS